jgi:membrane protease YdiL (CAAX protease family)/NAD-dependent dihydropyrimidine dehydrogenase PreA subunit
MSVTPTPLRLDTTACNRCGRCAPLCKQKAIRIGPGYIYVDWERCDACGKCADACDTGAITLRQMDAPVASVPLAPAATTRRSGSGAKRKPARAGGSAARPAADDSSGRATAWSLPEAGLVLAVAFALLVGVQAFTSAIGSASVWSGIALVVYDATVVALLWYLARRHDTAVATAFRLDSWPKWTSVLLSVAVAVGCWAFSLTYRAVVLQMGLTPSASEGADLTGLFGSGTLALAVTVVLVALVGPAIEEVLLRGVVMGAVQRRFGVWPAIVVSAVAFALLHASLWSLLPLTVLGVGLGWLAARSRSLWPPIIAHVLYNGVLVAAALYAAAH